MLESSNQSASKFLNISGDRLIMPIFRFRDCFLNTTERRAVRNGKNLKLTPKAFDLLELLIEKRGSIVSKDEILGKIWNGSFVEEGNLPVHISVLRRLLEESEDRTFIETAQGIGYRFVAPVHLVKEDEWEDRISARSDSDEKNYEGLLFGSIAVLPLHNEDHEHEIDYLADGLTESFINSLSHISGLQVLARSTVFRYKNKKVDPRKVGEILGVQAVLSGRLRIVKDSMMISVELTNVSAGSQIWGTRFHEPFTEIIEIQEKIAHGVSQKLISEISQVTRNSVKQFQTNDTEAYRLYLKGKFFLEKRTIPDVLKAIEYFQQSISRDPSNPYPYIEACEAYLLLNIFDQISFHEMLARLEPFLSVLAEGNQSIDVLHAMHGLRLVLSWKFELAEEHLEKAIAINPNCLAAHYRYVDNLTLTGRTREALHAMKYIPQLDPLSSLTHKRMGKMLWKLRRYESSIWHLTEALEMEPGNPQTTLMLGFTLAEVGKYDEAISILRESVDSGASLEALAMIAYTQARAGRNEDAYLTLERVFDQDRDGSNYLKAIIYGTLGESERAFDCLYTGLERHEIDLGALKADPRMDSLRNDERFSELIRKIGFPE